MRERIHERLVNWLLKQSTHFGTNNADQLGAICTTVGNRHDNQDRAIIARYDSPIRARSFVFHGLCDGIGGMRDGAKCASLGLAYTLLALTEQCSPSFDKANELLRACLKANERIFDEYHESGGATFSAIVTDHKGESFALNVGDSRIYRKTDKDLEQITVDDSIAGQLNLLGKEQIHENAFSRQLTQYVGIGKSLHIEIQPRMFFNGGVLFLSTDGIHSLPHRLLTDIALANVSSSEIGRRLVTIARWRKTSDNASIICVPQEFSNTVQHHPWQESGTLEVWDASGKLEMFVDLPEKKEPPLPNPIKERYDPKPKAAQLSLDGGINLGSEKKNRRKRMRKPKSKSEIEIIENPPA